MLALIAVVAMLAADGSAPEQDDSTRIVRAAKASADTSKTVLGAVTISADDDKVGFGMRRAGKVGQFITAADIARERPKNTVTLLRTRDGMQHALDESGAPIIKMTAGPGRACTPLVLVDGFPAPPTPPRRIGEMSKPGSSDAASLNWGVKTGDIGGVEIYNSPAIVPAQFVTADPRLNLKGSCGVIVIWTREKLGLPRSPP